MFCNKCGKQLPEGSAFCIECGAPVVNAAEGAANATVITEPVPENNETASISGSSKVEGTKNKLPVIVVAALIIVVVAFIAITTYRKSHGLDINANSVDITELYNPSLGIGLRLGMKRDVVDQKLGTPDPLGDDYRYTDTYLYVSYVDGKLAHMYISWPNDRWITKNGVMIGTTTDELQQLLGQPNSIEHDDKWWYYYSRDEIAGFEIGGNSVMSIYIYDTSLVTE